MERVQHLLKTLGLGDEEITIYLKLVDKPSGDSVDQILTSYGVQAAKGEAAVKDLAEHGLIRVVSNRAEAIEPKVFLGALLDHRRREMEKGMGEAQTIASELERILEPVYLEGRLGIRPEELLEPLRDLREMEVRTTGLIASATSSISIFAQTFGWFEKIREAFHQAKERGVKTRVLMAALDEPAALRLKELKEMGVAIRKPKEEWHPVRGTIVDGQELVFLIWATHKTQAPKPIYYRPHYTRNPGLIRIFEDAFEKRWESGEQL